MLRRLYNWSSKHAAHPKSLAILYFITFIEAAFFILPPDPILIAIGIQNPRRVLKISFIVSIFSVLGGLLGYIIGFYLWHFLEPWFFEYIFSAETFQKAATQYQENAIKTLIIVGFTPIPFKAFTIAAGAVQLSLKTFIIGALIGRSLRYLSIGFIIYLLGDRAKIFIEKYLEKITIAVSVLCITAYILYKYL